MLNAAVYVVSWISDDHVYISTCWSLADTAEPLAQRVPLEGSYFKLARAVTWIGRYNISAPSSPRRRSSYHITETSERGKRLDEQEEERDDAAAIQISGGLKL